MTSARNSAGARERGSRRGKTKERTPRAVSRRSERNSRKQDGFGRAKGTTNFEQLGNPRSISRPTRGRGLPFALLPWARRIHAAPVRVRSGAVRATRSPRPRRSSTAASGRQPPARELTRELDVPVRNGGTNCSPAPARARRGVSQPRHRTSGSNGLGSLQGNPLPLLGHGIVGFLVAVTNLILIDSIPGQACRGL